LNTSTYIDTPSAQMSYFFIEILLFSSMLQHSGDRKSYVPSMFDVHSYSSFLKWVALPKSQSTGSKFSFTIILAGLMSL
jgi:hypothetical protein